MATKCTPEEMEKRKVLFGRWSDGLRPLKPYQWRIDGTNGGLTEIPVTTMPIFKMPIHGSYILYLSMFSRTLSLLYFHTALKLCRLTGTQPSLLLHPLDFLGCDDTQELSFFPAMRLESRKKIKVISDVLNLLSGQFTVLTLEQHAHKTTKAADA